MFQDNTYNWITSKLWFLITIFMRINANPNNDNMSFQNYKMPKVSVLFDGSTLSLEIFELVVVTMRILFECFVVCWKEIKTFHQKLVSCWTGGRGTCHSLGAYWETHWSNLGLPAPCNGSGVSMKLAALSLSLGLTSASSWESDIWTIFQLSELRHCIGNHWRGHQKSPV